MNNAWIKKAMMMAALGSTAALSSAFMIDDAKILIDRAINSPTLTVKYSGAQATMVELRINGASVGTREVAATKSAGETNFSIDLKGLRDGDNDVEVRLFDKAGKLLGSEKSVITSDQGVKGPVFVVSPKVGEEIQGAVDIKVGFGQEFSNKYVSFFVDNQFRSMTNNAPFSYTWDTVAEAQGWHEVEIWVVDADGNTYKTRKVKVFVNNPGGQTTRPATTPTTPKTTVPNTNPTTTAVNGVKAINSATTAVATTTTIPPTTMLVGALPGAIKPKTVSQESLKPVVASTSTMMGPRTVSPAETMVVKTTGSKVSTPVVVPATRPKTNPVIEVNTSKGTVPTNLNPVKATNAAPITITNGTRLPNLGTFAISVNSLPVKFDVQPRVENGIPLTPFRHIFEADGGKVEWDNIQKMLEAHKTGQDVMLKVGNKTARVNKIDVDLEIAPFIERGRTIVPLSFISDNLNVAVEFDPATGHVLIKSKK